MSPIFAYVGPEVTIPALSVIATVAGFFLMFGKMAIRWAVYPFRWVVGRTNSVSVEGAVGAESSQAVAMNESSPTTGA